MGVSSILLVTSEVVSIVRNLERIKSRRKPNSKETRCDIDLTKSLDSVDLSQRTHQVTVSSHLETNLGLVDYQTARDARTSWLKKSRSKYQKYSPNKRYYIGKHALEFCTASTLRWFKAKFRELGESTVHSIRPKYDEELKVALK